MKQAQATSNPYSADNLAPHDTDLRFSRDHGTNTTENVGDEYNGSGEPLLNPVARIDARLGMLELNAFNMPDADQSYAPRGQTFAGPDLTDPAKFPPSIIGGEDAIVAVWYAKTLLRREPFLAEPKGGGELWGAGFVLGGDGLVGAAPSEVLLSCDTFFAEGPQGPLDARSGANVVVRTWDDGGEDDPNVCGVVASLAPHTVYWRIITFEDPELKFGTSFTVEWSADGLTWQFICFSAALKNPVRRYGFVTYGPVIACLDWVRVYSYVVTSFDDWQLIPAPPEVGGRLFIG